MNPRSMTILVALTMARIAFGYQFQTIGALTINLVERFGLTYTQVGTLVGAYMVLGAFAAVPLGLLGRRFGEGRVLCVGLALMTGGACISALAESPSFIGWGRTVAGLGAVAMVVLHNKVISEWYKGSWFILAISISVCSFPVGMGLSGLLLPNLVSSLGLRAALLSDAIPAGVALVLFALSYREPPHEAPVVRRFSLPGGTECLLLVIAGTTWMAYTAGFSGFISYLAAALTLRGYPLPVVGWVLTIGLWGNVIGTLAGGGLSLRLGRLTVFITGTSCLVIGMTVLTVTNLPIAGALVFGVLGSIQPGVVMAAAALSAKPENRAVGMGLFYTTYYVGNSTVPALCGLASDFAGGPEGGLVAATVLSAMAIPLFLLHRALANRRLHLIQI